VTVSSSVLPRLQDGGAGRRGGGAPQKKNQLMSESVGAQFKSVACPWPCLSLLSSGINAAALRCAAVIVPVVGGVRAGQKA
jgi:hypothetical protein